MHAPGCDDTLKHAGMGRAGRYTCLLDSWRYWEHADADKEGTSSIYLESLLSKVASTHDNHAQVHSLTVRHPSGCGG